MTNASPETVRAETIRILLAAGDRLVSSGDLSDAGAIYRQAHDMAIRLSAINASNVEWQTLHAAAQHRVAYVLAQQGKYAEALALYDELIAGFCASNEAALREQTTKSLFNKAVLFLDMGDSKRALSAYDQVIARYGDRPEDEFDEWLARAASGKAQILETTGNAELALTAYDALISRLGNNSASAMREWVLWSSLSKAKILSELKRDQDALAILNEVASEVKNAEKREHREILGVALLHAADIFDADGKDDEALVVFDQIIAEFDRAAEPVFQEWAAAARMHKAKILLERGDERRALHLCDEVIARSELDDAPIDELVALALHTKAITAQQSGRTREAIDLYDQIIVRFGQAGRIDLDRVVASAFLEKLECLNETAQKAKAAAFYEEFGKRFGDSTDVTIREFVERAMISRVKSLNERGRIEDEPALYDQIAAESAASSELWKRMRAVDALLFKANVLGELGRLDQAVVVVNQLAADFGRDDNLWIREAVAAALSRAAEWLEVLGRDDEASRTFDNALSILAPTIPSNIPSKAAQGIGVTADSTGKVGSNITDLSKFREKFRRVPNIPLRTMRILPNIIGVSYKQTAPLANFYTEEYLDDIVPIKIDLNRHAENLKLEPEDALEALDRAAAAKARGQELPGTIVSLRAREHPGDARTTAVVRGAGNEPAEAAFGRPSWIEARNRGESLPDFITRAYAAEKAEGTLSRATLRDNPELYEDHYNWSRRRHLPEDQHWLRDLPTKSQVIRRRSRPRRLADFGPDIQAAVREYERRRVHAPRVPKKKSRPRAPSPKPS